MKKDLDYTIWFVPVRPTPDHVYYDYKWSLATKTAKCRDETGAAQLPEMYAKLTVGEHQEAFHLLKMKHPVVSEPVRKRDIVEIFGRDGDIDLYEKLIPRPIFERREIEEQFLLLGQNAESGDYYVGNYREWAALISQLKNYFNSFTGQMRIVLSHDPGFYWEGRVTASIDELEPYRAILTITADVEPYKYERYHSAEPWIWDDFSFIDGIIRDYSNIPIVHNAGTNNSEYMVFAIPMRLRDVVPQFLASGSGVKVSTDLVNWYDVIYGDDADFAENGIQLTGTRSPYFDERPLYIKNTSGESRTISIMMRGATL